MILGSLFALAPFIFCFFLATKSCWRDFSGFDFWRTSPFGPTENEIVWVVDRFFTLIVRVFWSSGPKISSKATGVISTIGAVFPSAELDTPDTKPSASNDLIPK